MAGTDEYDEIFAALKHPLRRQILLLLEEKGEASFTEIQNAVGTEDTGLVSYHLKELAPLVEQSEKGKYCLSEIGRASITLFRRVEREKDKTSVAVNKAFENLVGKIFFALCIVGITFIFLMSVDIYLSINALYQLNFPSEQMFTMFLVSLGGMIFGVLMFVFYDRHYFSRSLRKNVIHTTLFGIIPALFSIFSLYIMDSFEKATLSDGTSLVWPFGVLRAISLLIAAPIVAYVSNKLLERR